MPINAKNEDDSGLQEDASKTSQVTDTPGINGRSRRLGIFQLGLYAHEKTAPARSLELMTTDTAIRIPHIIPILAKASEQDPSAKVTYLCHPSIQYITKLRSEGSYCGYRNIQMMISYILGSADEGEDVEAFASGIPLISQIQDLIEDAWDKGINSDGRVETGGIRRTRKYIGTPEVQALFKGLGIPCRVGRYAHTSSEVAKTARGSYSAFCLLLDYVEDHFKASIGPVTGRKVYTTRNSPIYLQRPHHSLTIIGIEFRTDGTRNLLVLDPKSRPSRAVLHAAEAITDGQKSDKCVSLKSFRRSRWDLGLYRQFETLSLQARA